VRADLQFRSIPALARAAGARFGDVEAIVDGDTRLSFEELAATATTAARAFVASGIQPGDRVAIWAPNSWEWVVALLGLQSAGAVLVPLNTRFKGTEAGYILRRSRARALCTVGEFLGTSYVDLLDGRELPDLATVVLLRGESPVVPGWAEFCSRAASAEAGDVDARIASLGPDAVADLIFTSGTTGVPKGVVATHGQALRAFGDWAEIVGLAAGDRYLIVNPMFHTFGYKAGIVACLIAGATMLPARTFDVDAVLDLIARERVTVLPGPPTIYQSLLRNSRRAATDLSSLRLAATGAAVIPSALVGQMKAELGFETVITAYGLTEACGFVTACRQGDDAETIASTSGRAIPDVEVRVVDEAGGEVPRGSTGEIVCRGYNVMQGYFEDPDQTSEAIDARGWLHTGDIGTMDERGNLRIVDRKKDLFIVGGFNAYPAEIENLLLANPAIAQAAVVGVPDDRLGEVGEAFIVLQPGADLDEDSLLLWARGEMANFKIPRRVHFVEALPLNASGKIVKGELRRRLARPGDS